MLQSIEREKKRANKLLLQLFPEHIAERLKDIELIAPTARVSTSHLQPVHSQTDPILFDAQQTAAPIAERFSDVTILFSDIVSVRALSIVVHWYMLDAAEMWCRTVYRNLCESISR